MGGVNASGKKKKGREGEKDMAQILVHRHPAAFPQSRLVMPPIVSEL